MERYKCDCGHTVEDILIHTIALVDNSDTKDICTNCFIEADLKFNDYTNQPLSTWKFSTKKEQSKYNLKD